MTVRTIRRDSFARMDIVRATVPAADRVPCHWCGARPGRFRYGVHADGIRTRPVFTSRVYCCAGCHRCAEGGDR